MFLELTGGLVTRRDPRMLKPGELIRARGVERRPGTKSLFATGMRAAAGTFGGAAHTGLMWAQYEGNTSQVVGGSGTSLYEAAATSDNLGTASLATLEGSTLAYASTPTRILGKLDRDRLYVASGVGLAVTRGGSSVTRKQNLVRSALTTAFSTTVFGNWRLMGMYTPSYQPQEVSRSTTAASTTYAIASGSSNWVNLTKVADTDDDSYSAGTLKDPANGTTLVQLWTFASNTTIPSGARLRILHSLRQANSGDGSNSDTGSSQQHPGKGTLKIEVSFNGGSTYSEASFLAAPYPKFWTDIDLSGSGITNMNQVFIRATVTYDRGAGPLTGRMHTIKIANANTTTTTTTGVRYLVSEFSEPYGLESSPGPESTLFALAAVTNFKIDLPSAAENFITTHYFVYRQIDGGALGELDKYGLVGKVKVSDASNGFLDFFDSPVTRLTTPICPVLVVGQGADIVFVSKNDPPPCYSSMCFYKGSLIGIPVDDPNNVYYSHPFAPESRPPLYAIPSRSPRDDTPRAVATIDDLWVIMFESWTRQVRGLPIVVDGVFDTTQYAELSADRGCAGAAALDNFTMPNETGTTWLALADARGVWVTNGYHAFPWSEEIVWLDPITPANGLVEPAYVHKTIVRNNHLKRRIEVFFVPVGGTTLTRRLDLFYGEMEGSSGQPEIYGPHTVLPPGDVAQGFISGTEKRFVGGTTGLIYLEDSGNSDASSADGSTNVTRDLITGDIPIAELGGEGYLNGFQFRCRGGASVFTLAASLKFSSGEVMTLPGSETATAPQPFGVFASGETWAIELSEASTLAKSEILGIEVDAETVSKKRGGLTSAYGSSAGSNSLPS